MLKVPTTVKGKMLDVQFDAIKGARGGDFELVLTVPESSVSLYECGNGEVEIRVLGDQQGKDFLAACSNFWLYLLETDT